MIFAVHVIHMYSVMVFLSSVPCRRHKKMQLYYNYAHEVMQAASISHESICIKCDLSVVLASVVHSADC